MKPDEKTDLWLKGVLAHYGVKGMRWGVRRSAQKRYTEGQTGRAEIQKSLGFRKSGQKREEHVERLRTGQANVQDHARSGGLFVKSGPKKEKEVSDDAAKAASAQTKAKKQGTQALSNQEMQALVNRMNLERQLTQLTPASRTQKGAKFAGKLVERHANRQVDMLVDYGVGKALESAGIKKRR